MAATRSDSHWRAAHKKLILLQPVTCDNAELEIQSFDLLDAFFPFSLICHVKIVDYHQFIIFFVYMGNAIPSVILHNSFNNHLNPTKNGEQSAFIFHRLTAG